MATKVAPLMRALAPISSSSRSWSGRIPYFAGPKNDDWAPIIEAAIDELVFWEPACDTHDPKPNPVLTLRADRDGNDVRLGGIGPPRVDVDLDAPGRQAADGNVIDVMIDTIHRYAGQITLVTLGLFILVLNAAMFALVAALLDKFVVSGFWAALFGAVIVSITSTIASWYIGPDGHVEVIVVNRR